MAVFRRPYFDVHREHFCLYLILLVATVILDHVSRPCRSGCHHWPHDHLTGHNAGGQNATELGSLPIISDCGAGGLEAA